MAVYDRPKTVALRWSEDWRSQSAAKQALGPTQGHGRPSRMGGARAFDLAAAL